MFSQEPANGFPPISSMLVCLLLAATAAAQEPTKASLSPVTDKQVDEAIRRGLDYLYRSQQADGTWATDYSDQHPGGVESLVLLAALSAGEDPALPPLKAALARINGAEPETVYARAFRAMVYARLAGGDYARRLADDVNWLVKCQGRTGGWGYGVSHSQRTDASNTQFALLALREAADAGADVPPAVWQSCREYWTRVQNGDDGGWGYEPPGRAGGRLRGSSYGSMTAAGVASLFIATEKSIASGQIPYHDVDARRSQELPERQAMDRALAWMTRNYAIREIPAWVWGRTDHWLHYYLYCLARAADASGLREIASHDWWAELAAFLRDSQHQDGSWEDPRRSGNRKDAPIGTCFALLSLCLGRRPVLINKLSWNGTWTDDSCDAANLARWYSRQLAHPVTWQLVSPDAPQQVFAEAPILYINGGSQARLHPTMDRMFRQFVGNGGTVLVQPFAGNEQFAQTAREYFVRVFRDYHDGKLTPDHPVFNLRFEIPADRQPSVIGIGDYCRTRIFILTSDVSGVWHQDRHKDSPQAFQFVANLVLYTTNMDQPQGKLTYRRPLPTAPEPPRSIPVARVRHAGDWDACPLAMPRLNAALAQAVSIGVKERDAVDLSHDPPADAPLLWMTGSVGPKLNVAQRSGLKRYLLGGGMLFIDSAMGRKEFFEAAWQILREMFPDVSLSPLPRNHPLLTGRFAGGIGSDVTEAQYTRHALPDLPGRPAPSLHSLELGGRTAVILSRDGVTCPVEGNPTYGCAGLQTDDARRLAANVILYAAWKKQLAGSAAQPRHGPQNAGGDR